LLQTVENHAVFYRFFIAKCVFPQKSASN
jgi:hypothetical protein